MYTRKLLRTKTSMCELSSLGKVMNMKTDGRVFTLISFVTVKTSDAALDVPAGDCFKVLEKICLMNAPSHNGRPRTTVRFSGRIEFTKSTWLKSIIEKSALEGIRTYFEDLDKMVTELAAIEDRDLSHLSVEEAEGLRKRVSGAPTTPETPQTAVPVGASGSFEATPISHRIEPPGVVGVAVDILFFLLRFFGGAEGWAPRRIALSLAGFVAIFIVLAHLLLLWKLTTILGEINENLIEMRTSWATAGLRQGVAP